MTPRKRIADHAIQVLAAAGRLSVTSGDALITAIGIRAGVRQRALRLQDRVMQDEDGRRRTRLGLRWNGTEISRVGNPTSHGVPTWFLVPEGGIEEAVRPAIGVESSGS